MVNTNSFIKNTINNNGSSVVVYSNSIDASTEPTVFSSGINRNDDNFIISQGSDLLLPVLKISALGNVEIQNDLIVKGNTSINNTNNQYFEDSNIDLGIKNTYTIKDITDITTTASSTYSYPNSASYSATNTFYLFTSDFNYLGYNSYLSSINAQYNYNSTVPINIEGVKDSSNNLLTNINKLNPKTNIILGFGALPYATIAKSLQLNDFAGGSNGNSFWNRNNYTSLDGLPINLILSAGSDAQTYFISNSTYDATLSILSFFIVLNVNEVVTTSTATPNPNSMTPSADTIGFVFLNSFIVNVLNGTAASTTDESLRNVVTGQVLNNTSANTYGITWNYCSTGGTPLTKSIAFDSDATGTGGALNINSSDSNGDAQTYFKFDYYNKKFQLLNPTDNTKYNSLQLDSTNNSIFTSSGDYTINANSTGASSFAVNSSGAVAIGATGTNGSLALTSFKNMSQTAVGNLTQTVSGDVTINANSTGASSFAVNSAGAVAIGATGTNGSLALTSFKNMSQTAVGNLTQTVSGDVTINANSTGASSFAVNSAGAVAIGATGSNGSLALTSLKNMSQTAVGNLTQTVSGDVTINANSTGASSFAVNSAGAVAIGATGTNGNLALTSLKDMSQTAVGNMSQTATGNLTQTVSGDVTINANSTGASSFAVNSAGAVAIGATGTNGSLALTSLKNMSQTAVGNLTQTVSGDVSINANSTGASSFAVNSAGGISIGATGTNGSLTLTSFKNMSQTAVGNLTQTVSGDVTINANSTGASSFALNSAGTVAIGATGTNGNLTLTSFKDMSQTATGNFAINANSSATNAFGITSQGGLILGATGTNGSLSLNSYQAMNIGLGATNGMIITSNAAATNSNHVLQMYCGSTRLYWFDNLGNHTALTSVSALSDNRLKTNIQPIENCLDKVMNLNGVYFNWTDYERSSKRNIGLIAQNVQSVVPELVNDSDEYLSVNYSQMVAVLIGAIQEQQKQIDELKAKLA